MTTLITCKECGRTLAEEFIKDGLCNDCRGMTFNEFENIRNEKIKSLSERYDKIIAAEVKKEYKRAPYSTLYWKIKGNNKKKKKKNKFDFSISAAETPQETQQK